MCGRPLNSLGARGFLFIYHVLSYKKRKRNTFKHFCGRLIKKVNNVGNVYLDFIGVLAFIYVESRTISGLCFDCGSGSAGKITELSSSVYDPDPT